MSRLRNRMTRAEFWTDPDLLSMPLAKRHFYQGLRAAAEDSGCDEDSPFGWMCLLFSSPLDREVSLETVTKWRDELLADAKLVRYVVAGKPYLYQTTFHVHEHPRNPQAPSIPLPSWVRWVGNDSDTRKGRYELLTRDGWKQTKALQQASDVLFSSSSEHCSTVEEDLFNTVTTPPALSCPVLSGPDRIEEPLSDSKQSDASLKDEFALLWEKGGKIGSRARAWDSYRWWRGAGKASADELLSAVVRYQLHCAETGSYAMHVSTFLCKPTKTKSALWPEWANGEQHGQTDVSGTARLSDVLNAGAEAFGLNGGKGGNGSGTIDGRRPARTTVGGKNAGRGLPPGKLEDGK